jgi:hypothetical protein
LKTSDYKYKYTDPIDSGFTKFKLTKKQHNEIFPKRKIKWTNKYEYYYNERTIILHEFINWKTVLLVTILFPVIILLEGLMNIKESWKDFVKLYKQKESGSFVSEHVRRDAEKYQQVMDVVKSD